MSDQETLRERLDKVTCPLCQQGVPFLDDQPSIIHKDGNGNLIGCRSQAAAILPIVQAELAALRERSERRFPIQDGASVPWEVMAPHQAQSQKNHHQSLERIAERGGFGAAEAWLIVNALPLNEKRDGKHYEWDWVDLKRKWQEYAERINFHFKELEELRALREPMACGHPKVCWVEADTICENCGKGQSTHAYGKTGRKVEGKCNDFRGDDRHAIQAHCIVCKELAALREQVVRECGRHALFLRYEADHGGARDYLLAREEEARYIEGFARALLTEGGKS